MTRVTQMLEGKIAGETNWEILAGFRAHVPSVYSLTSAACRGNDQLALPVRLFRLPCFLRFLDSLMMSPQNKDNPAFFNVKNSEEQKPHPPSSTHHPPNTIRYHHHLRTILFAISSVYLFICCSYL